MPGVIHVQFTRSRKMVTDSFNRVIDTLKIKNPDLIDDLKATRDEIINMVAKHEANPAKLQFNIPARLTTAEREEIDNAVRVMTTRYSQIHTDLLAEICILKVNECFARHGVKK